MVFRPSVALAVHTWDINGAGDGARTRDIQLGRLALYQLSYPREPRFISVARSALLSLPKSPSFTYKASNLHSVMSTTRMRVDGLGVNASRATEESRCMTHQET